MFKYFNKQIWLTESIIQKLVDINNWRHSEYNFAFSDEKIGIALAYKLRILAKNNN